MSKLWAVMRAGYTAPLTLGLIQSPGQCGNDMTHGGYGNPQKRNKSVTPPLGKGVAYSVLPGKEEGAMHSDSQG